MSALTGKIGPQAGHDNQQANVALDREARLTFGGKYADASRRGTLFMAASTAAVTSTIALATTYKGLMISNPAGSGKVLSIRGFRYSLSVAQAAISSLHLLGGYSAAGVVTHTTPLASPGIQNCLIGAAETSVANADAAATAVNPVYLIPYLSGFTAGAFGGMDGGWLDLDGMFTLRPGAWIASGSLTVVIGFVGFVWEEFAE